MQLTFEVSIEVEHQQGKFVPKDELADLILEALDEAANNVDLDGLGPDSTSTYDIIDVAVTRTYEKV